VSDDSETRDGFIRRAAAGPALLSVRGRVQWPAGQRAWMLTSGLLAALGHAGGLLCGLMAMGRPLVPKGTRQLMAFCALNEPR